MKFFRKKEERVKTNDFELKLFLEYTPKYFMLEENDILIEKAKNYIVEITKEEYDSAELLSELESQIVANKQSLADSDYKAIKFLEGEMETSEYLEVASNRKNWRAQINSFEEKISLLLEKFPNLK